MTKSPRIWISWWQGEVKTAHVSNRTTISRSPTSSPPMEVSTDFIESEKVERQAVSGRIFLCKQSVFCPKTFPFHVCTMDTGGSGNKRPTEKSEQKTKEKQHTVSRILPVRMLFWYSTGGIFFECWMKWAGGKLRSLQKNQPGFFRACEYLPLSGPIRRSTPSSLILAICFSTALAVMPIRSARAAALNVLSWESRAMIFSLLFEESAVTISNTEIWMTANEIADLFYVHVGAVTTTIRRLQKEGIVKEHEACRYELPEGYEVNVYNMEISSPYRSNLTRDLPYCSANGCWRHQADWEKNWLSCSCKMYGIENGADLEVRERIDQ